MRRQTHVAVVGRVIMRQRRYLSRYVDYHVQCFGRFWD
jgi:hypothetical protein